jgi:hypothetical protein
MSQSPHVNKSVQIVGDRERFFVINVKLAQLPDFSKGFQTPLSAAAAG